MTYLEFNQLPFDATMDQYGTIIDGLNCEWDSLESFLGHVLGFCGCGCPEDALLYVYLRMKLLHDYVRRDFDSRYLEEESQKLFTSYGERYFFYYYLDDKKLTEHGGAVPGWLTAKGLAVLACLEHLNTNKSFT